MKANQAILKAILNCGSLSRAQLSKRLGLSASAVSEAASSMLEQGMLVEAGYINDQSRGRKNILLDIDTSFAFALGVGLINTTLCVGIATVKGQTLAKRVLTLDSGDGIGAIRAKAESAIEDVMKDCCLDKSKILGAGVCLTKAQAKAFGIDDSFLSELGIKTVIEPADEFLEYSGAYMPINPSELYIFGCARVVREMYC